MRFIQPCRRGSRVTASVVVAFSMGLVGCGNENRTGSDEPRTSPEPKASVESLPTDSAMFANAEPAKATARGLIAAVLRHLDAGEVLSVGVAEPDNRYTPPAGMEPAPGSASVTLKDGTTIFVSVSDLFPGRSPFSCSFDTGYDAIACEENPYRFIGRLNTESEMTEGMPDYEVRTRGPRRGEVLVQIVTARPQVAVVGLAQRLLNDTNIGMRTTAGLNAQGAALKNVQVDRVEVSSEVSRS